MPLYCLLLPAIIGNVSKFFWRWYRYTALQDFSQNFQDKNYFVWDTENSRPIPVSLVSFKL